jgi:DNA polymerase-3 subunit epsilon
VLGTGQITTTILEASAVDFVAIDVETANAQWGSVCSFGAVEVVDGKILARHSWLSKPPADLDWFDGMNTQIHGITAGMVADAPTFAESLRHLLGIIDGRPVVAHNAAFDIGNLRRACTAESIEWPELRYACTLVLSRRTYDLPSYSLPIVADHLNIDLAGHHDAGSDADAAAQVMLHLARHHGTTTVEDTAAGTGVRIGRLYPDTWRGCVATYASTGAGAPLIMPGANPDADPDHPLFGRVVVFTGGLGITRREAAAAVAALGAQPESGVTKRTDFLVIGDGFTGSNPADFHTGKAAKAMKWRSKGRPIEVLTEVDLIHLLTETETAGSADRRLQPAHSQAVPALG